MTFLNSYIDRVQCLGSDRLQGGMLYCDMSPYCSAHDEWLIMKLCMYVGYHTANNVSNFGGDPVTQIKFKNVDIFLRCFTGTALHSRDAATGFAAVAMRSHADCGSMVVPVYWSTLQWHIVGREHVLAFPRSKRLDWNHTSDTLVNS